MIGHTEDISSDYCVGAVDDSVMLMRAVDDSVMLMRAVDDSVMLVRAVDDSVMLVRAALVVLSGTLAARFSVQH